MPRRNRCLIPGVACHITQRGVDRCETFSSDQDRLIYLGLLIQNLAEADVRILGWCLMTNHLHLIAIPGREDSLAVLLRRVHGRYAQYYNTRVRRSGHLWQNRFFACMLGGHHLWTALTYVDENPVRAGLVRSSEEYLWSSADAHRAGRDEHGVIDMISWRRAAPPVNADLGGCAAIEALRRCTYAGRPFGDDAFVQRIADRFGRRWTRGRPKKEEADGGSNQHQLLLFG